jgi:4-hydroxybenzoate polyprenyltransferase
MTAFLPMFLLGYAGNITTALPDAPADRAVGKRSYPVRRGEFRARRDSLIVIALALALAPWSFGQHVSWPWAVSSGAALACLLVNLRGITHADADRARACLRFVTLSGAAIAIAELAFISALVTSRTGAG